jgi:hypothetical protein
VEDGKPGKSRDSALYAMEGTDIADLERRGQNVTFAACDNIGDPIFRNLLGKSEIAIAVEMQSVASDDLEAVADELRERAIAGCDAVVETINQAERQCLQLGVWFTGSRCMRVCVIATSITAVAHTNSSCRMPCSFLLSKCIRYPSGMLMFKLQIPVEVGNDAIKAGRQTKIFEALIKKIKPEAASGLPRRHAIMELADVEFG